LSAPAGQFKLHVPRYRREPERKQALTRERHLAGDWLLIYKLEGDTVIFERTRSHAELL